MLKLGICSFGFKDTVIVFVMNGHIANISHSCELNIEGLLRLCFSGNISSTGMMNSYIKKE
jgi:hypothetical protein